MVAADARTAIVFARSPGNAHDAPEGRSLSGELGPMLEGIPMLRRLGYGQGGLEALSPFAAGHLADGLSMLAGNRIASERASGLMVAGFSKSASNRWKTKAGRKIQL